MTFVTLDNKDWCKGIYHNGSLHFDNIPDNISKTWKYAHYLKNKNVDYAFLYAQGKSLDDLCPLNLKDSWEKQKAKLIAYNNSFIESKIDLEQNCFFDLVPQQFLLEFCELKVKIINHVFETHTKPDNYNFLLELETLVTQISNQKLNIDLSPLKKNLHESRARVLLERLSKTNNAVDYNIFGSKTGRLTTKKDTFPILNLDSKYKSIIKPKNNVFVELDYNAAEVRTLLALSGRQQPQEDIHEWNAKRLGLTREQAKTEIFSWLYGSTKVDSKKYENYFDLNKMLDQFYDGFIIKNLYKRKIKTDQFHSLNYLIQSTTSDLVLNQIIKISKILEKKTSFISFIVHDSVVIDLAKEDKELISNIINTFQDTDLGKFPVNVSIGKDYGTLRKL